jgi:hypothetical protein
MRRLLLLAAALTLAGCGAARTVTVTRTQTGTTTAAIAPASPSTPPPAAELTRAEAARVNREITAFDSKATSHDSLGAATAATVEAAMLSGLAARHVGTPLSHQLTAASDDWIAVSSAILHGDRSALSQAERKATHIDAQIRAAGT